MAEVADFVGTIPLVDHNAGFDSRFWDAELSRICRRRSQSFVCSMLLAKRLMPEAASYKLGSLVALAGLPSTGQAHRALADAEMAAHLTLYLERELQRRFGLATVTLALLERIQTVPKSGLQKCVERYGSPRT
jgi:DNA polymerase-3 subunit epsilon